MKKHVGGEILNAKPGYYWSRFANEGRAPEPIYVSARKQNRNNTWYIKLNFPYPDEAVVRGDTEFPEYLQTLTLFGPIEIPSF